MGCSTGCTQACRGAIYQRDTARGRPCTAGSDGGPGAGSGTAFSTRCSESLTVSERSSGHFGVLMDLPFGHTSTQRAREKNQRVHRRLGEPEDHALGRSRGGFTTKLHLVTDGRGLPLSVELSAGQAQESRYAAPVLSAVRIGQPEGRRGRPRTRPLMVAGDKGYDNAPVRRWLREHGIGAVIPEKKRPAHWRARRGRPLKFDHVVYRRRNAIERCVGWLKEARRVATRFEKLAVHYLGVLKLMMIKKHLKLCLSNTP